MDAVWPDEDLRGSSLLSATLVVITTVSFVTLVAFLWSYAAAWLRAWKMLYKLPGPPILIPMAYVIDAQIALYYASKSIGYNAGRQ